MALLAARYMADDQRRPFSTELRRAILEAPDTMDMEYVRDYVDVGGP